MRCARRYRLGQFGRRMVLRTAVVTLNRKRFAIRVIRSLERAIAMERLVGHVAEETSDAARAPVGRVIELRVGTGTNRRAEPPSSGDCGQVLAQLPYAGREAKVDSQAAAPAETRTPNWHRANHRSSKSADGRMAAEAEGLPIRPLDGNHKTCLTRIGLLMEGLENNLLSHVIGPQMPWASSD